MVELSCLIRYLHAIFTMYYEIIPDQNSLIWFLPYNVVDLHLDLQYLYLCRLVYILKCYLLVEHRFCISLKTLYIH